MLNMHNYRKAILRGRILFKHFAGNGGVTQDIWVCSYAAARPSLSRRIMQKLIKLVENRIEDLLLKKVKPQVEQPSMP